MIGLTWILAPVVIYHPHTNKYQFFRNVRGWTKKHSEFSFELAMMQVIHQFYKYATRNCGAL